MMATGILPGPYRVPAYRSVCHFRLTNKTPAATYRAPGRYETTFVRERLIEAIAHALNLDSDRGAPPQRHHGGGNAVPRARSKCWARMCEHDTGDYMGLLDKVLAHVSWDALQADLRASARRAANWSAPASPCSWRRAGSGRRTA